MSRKIRNFFAVLLVLVGLAVFAYPTLSEAYIQWKSRQALAEIEQMRVPETTAPETTAPETTAPKTREVQVIGDRIPVIRLLLEGGQTLEVTGYEGTYAKVTAGKEQGLVETGFLRFPDEPFESRTTYALWNAGLYPDFSCLGEPLEKLATNTKLEVLEEQALLFHFF